MHKQQPLMLKNEAITEVPKNLYLFKWLPEAISKSKSIPTDSYFNFTAEINMFSAQSVKLISSFLKTDISLLY